MQRPTWASEEGRGKEDGDACAPAVLPVPAPACAYCAQDYREFEKIMSRDIRQYDNEADLKAAWKVRACVRVCGAAPRHAEGRIGC